MVCARLLLISASSLPIVWSWTCVWVASLPSRRNHVITRSTASWEIPGGGRGSLKRFLVSAKSFARADTASKGGVLTNDSSTAVASKTEVASISDKGNWRALGELAWADKSLLAVSSLSLVAAALCDAGLPKYSAAALSSIVTSDAAGFTASMKGFLLLSVVRVHPKEASLNAH